MKHLSITCIKRFSAWIVMLFIALGLAGQNNLIRNHSFEHRAPFQSNNYPNNTGQLERSARWKSVNNTSTDWFRNNSANHVHGAAGCVRGGWDLLPQIPDDDQDHYAGLHKNPLTIGEGVQQKLPHKLRNKTYILRFDYFVPCETNAYRFDLYFGGERDSLTYHAKFDTLDRQNVGQWHTYQTSFNVSPVDAQLYDWFIWVFDGDLDAQNPYSPDGSYLFIDNFNLEENPLTCAPCDPDGLISWNDQSDRPYMTPDNNGIFDQWCISNINNVSWYEFFVFDRWGATVYSDIQSNPNGYENLSLCWDGRNNNGQMLNVPDSYNAVVRLGNCGTQITKWYPIWTSNDLAHDTFSVAQNYVPPLYGLQQPPTHYQNLYLYGGTYWGNHDWYACDSIFVGGYGAPRVPYFIAGSTANLGFYSTEGTFIDTGSTDFQLGSDIDIVPQPVQCCPSLRLANPGLPGAEAENLEALSEHGPPTDSEEFQSNVVSKLVDEFTLAVYPNPVSDLLTIVFHLPNQNAVKATLMNASGVKVSEIIQPTTLEAGDHSFSVSMHAVPSGMYFLQFQMGIDLTTMKLSIVK